MILVPLALIVGTDVTQAPVRLDVDAQLQREGCAVVALQIHEQRRCGLIAQARVELLAIIVGTRAHDEAQVDLRLVHQRAEQALIERGGRDEPANSRR